jgi:predicted Fe-Mo cluster-binding NifX family protein
MKIAIASKGNDHTALLDKNFGHCSCFVIFEPSTEIVSFVPNPFKEAPEKAGKMAVEFLYNLGVKKIISGDFGLKVKPLLDSLKIQMIVIKDNETDIQSILNKLKNTSTNSTNSTT